MAKAAHDPKLKTAFEAHLKETGGQVERLNQAFGLLDAKIEANSPCLKWPRRSRADFRLFSAVPTPSTARPQRVVATLRRLKFDQPFAKMKIGVLDTGC